MTTPTRLLGTIVAASLLVCTGVAMAQETVTEREPKRSGLPEPAGLGPTAVEGPGPPEAEGPAPPEGIGPAEAESSAPPEAEGSGIVERVLDLQGISELSLEQLMDMPVV